jgi:hypothetical protein
VKAFRKARGLIVALTMVMATTLGSCALESTAHAAPPRTSATAASLAGDADPTYFTVTGRCGMVGVFKAGYDSRGVWVLTLLLMSSPAKNVHVQFQYNGQGRSQIWYVRTAKVLTYSGSAYVNGVGMFVDGCGLSSFNFA